MSFWSFFELCVVVISAKNTCGRERAEWEGVCSVCWMHWKCSAAEWKAVVHKQGNSHKPSRLARRSVQTAPTCAFPQPSRESKLHAALKGFFKFLISNKPVCFGFFYCYVI